MSYTDLRQINTSNAITISFLLNNASNLEGAMLNGLELTWLDLPSISLKNACFEGCNLINANFQKVINLENTIFSKAKLIDANFFNLDLSLTDLSGADLTGAKLTGSKINKKNLLKASSIRDIQIDSETLKKNNYTNGEIIELKQKLVQDYKQYFDSCTNIETLCEKLNSLALAEKHVLKIKRTGIFIYGNTDASAAVINYGRKKLLELVESYSSNQDPLDESTITNLKSLQYNDYALLDPVFNKNIYTISLWGSAQSNDNAKKVFEAFKYKIDIALKK